MFNFSHISFYSKPSNLYSPSHLTSSQYFYTPPFLLFFLDLVQEVICVLATGKKWTSVALNRVVSQRVITLCFMNNAPASRMINGLCTSIEISRRNVRIHNQTQTFFKGSLILELRVVAYLVPKPSQNDREAKKGNSRAGRVTV